MPADLSPCRPVFDRDPALYLDLTEPVRRGTGTVCYAAQDGALVAVELEDGGGLTLYTLWARDGETARRLCRLIPPHPFSVTAHEASSLPALGEAFGYKDFNPCRQAGYFSRKPMPEPDIPFVVRPLGPEHLSLVAAHYHLTGADYVLGRLEAGVMIGAFTPRGDLAGFMGTHDEGTMGLLEVLPPYCRQGVARLLQSHMTNLALERDEIPYGQIFDGNSPSLALQQSLGFQCSRGFMYWPEFQ